MFGKGKHEFQEIKRKNDELLEKIDFLNRELATYKFITNEKEWKEKYLEQAAINNELSREKSILLEKSADLEKRLRNSEIALEQEREKNRELEEWKQKFFIESSRIRVLMNEIKELRSEKSSLKEELRGGDCRENATWSENSLNGSEECSDNRRQLLHTRLVKLLFAMYVEKRDCYERLTYVLWRLANQDMCFSEIPRTGNSRVCSHKDSHSEK